MEHRVNYTVITNSLYYAKNALLTLTTYFQMRFIYEKRLNLVCIWVVKDTNRELYTYTQKGQMKRLCRCRLWRNYVLRSLKCHNIVEY